MTHSSYKYHKYIDIYMADVRTGRVKAGKRLIKAMDFIETKIDNDNTFIDTEKIDEAKRIIEEYFEIELLNWQLFIIALIHCYYKDRDMVIFDEFLILMGRGNGKNGFISPLIWYLTTHIHGIRGYNVEIIANNEEQAKTSFNDVYEMLDENWARMRRGFHKTKEQITSKTTRSYIKYNTSNARTKDGKRSACLVFDEIHEYENYDSINVFKSGFGKRKHSRVFYITTQGYVRGGVLDNELKKADDILNGVITELGYVPLIWELDDEKEAEEEENWEKANPSIEYFPDLMNEARKHWIDAKYQKDAAIEFYTKRMNLPQEDTYTAVAPWEKILATNKPIPYKELEGLDCVGGIDYASIHDFCSVGLLFKHNGKRYWIEHTFVNHKALKIESREIKFPVMEMVDRGLITKVKDETIRPETVSNWFVEQAKKYNIVNIAADLHRASYLKQEFETVGLPLEIVRSGPITHSKLSPLIDSMFGEETLIWGDNPTMNWYTNNTYKDFDKKGNISYHKIEPQTRKTDGFHALIHALVLDDELEEYEKVENIGVITF